MRVFVIGAAHANGHSALHVADPFMLIYKIADAPAWQAALACGHYAGSADDLRDGFIHMSTAGQAPATLAKHFRGRTDLIIAAIDPARLGAPLKWEPSRGGALFPHLYTPLSMSAVVWWRPLPLRADGRHELPSEAV